jgi:hypothetical protein
MSINFIIYIILLENNKYYVGRISELKPNFDPIGSNSYNEYIFNSHITTSNSEWTNLFSPIKIVESFITNDIFDKDKTTEKYMLTNGIENVRGGMYIETKLYDWQINSLEDKFKSIKSINNLVQISDDIYTKYLEQFNTSESIETEITCNKELIDNINLHTSLINTSKNIDFTNINNLFECVPKELLSIHNIDDKLIEIINKANQQYIEKYKITFKKNRRDDEFEKRLLNIINKVISDKYSNVFSEHYKNIIKKCFRNLNVNTLDAKIKLIYIVSKQTQQLLYNIIPKDILISLDNVIDIKKINNIFKKRQELLLDKLQDIVSNEPTINIVF